MIVRDECPFTVLIEFAVPAERQAELLDALTAQIDAGLPGVDGFVSATLHASVDGCTVVNYARWSSRQAWERATGLSALQTGRLHDDGWAERRRDTWFDDSVDRNPVLDILERLGGSTRGVTAFENSRVIVARVPSA